MKIYPWYGIVLLMILFISSATIIYAQGPRAHSGDELVQIAEQHRRNAQPDSAVMYYQRASEAFQNTGSSESLINAYNQLGVILTRQDKYDDALHYLRSALALEQDAQMDIHPLVAVTYISLGVVYNALEKYDTSLMHHHKALDMRLKLYGENHADVATSYGNLGNVYLYSGQFEKSIEAHTKAMQIREIVFGLNSPEIVESYRGLGNVYKELKEYHLSLSYFHKALQNKILQYGENAKELSRFYTYVSDAYYLLGDKENGDWHKAKAEELKR